MNLPLHLTLKFPNTFDIAGNGTDTIEEHRSLCETNNRLIWGESSQRTSNGVSEKNRKRIKQQIHDGINTYTFFLANNKGNQELYVGRMINIYGKGEISSTSELKKYIPSYYASNVGTTSDTVNLFVDVTTFFKIDTSYLDSITVESTGKIITTIHNSSPIFLVNINNKLEKTLAELIANSELNYQYQIEKVNAPQSSSIEDSPKKKPTKTLVNGTKAYTRNPETAKNAVVAARYQCEIDVNHKDFISEATKENYVEAHHLIPMEYQDDFESSIDIEANIICLCATCHKKLHHAIMSEKRPLIEKLYYQRIKRLKDCNVNITLQDLLKYYDCNGIVNL